jgi:phage baseplate assembly protein W
MANNKHLYSDLDLRFNATLSTGDVSMKYDTQAVIASIKNLLNTNKYDRPFQPEISSGLNALLFEPLTNITATLIENEIVRVIKNYEPRAQIYSVLVTADPDTNRYDVYLTVFIANQTQPTAINLILTRTR